MRVMKVLKCLVLLLIIVSCSSETVVENEVVVELDSNSSSSKPVATFNFSLGESTIIPQKKYNKQGVEIFGCNTFITNKNTNNWGGDTNGLSWNTPNQVFKNIPYGDQKDFKTDSIYFVSKYYIASPPVFHRNDSNSTDSNTIFDIGIVTPK